MGDFHQPLHETTRVSSAHIGGDRGGNDFKINFGRISNLHALWDQTMDKI